jgi:hypothetical protein
MYVKTLVLANTPLVKFHIVSVSCKTDKATTSKMNTVEAEISMRYILK